MADVTAARVLLYQADVHRVRARTHLDACLKATRDAYAALPVGVVLHMPGLPNCEDVRLQKTEDGWLFTDGGGTQLQGEEWVVEQWENGNLQILDEATVADVVWGRGGNGGRRHIADPSRRRMFWSAPSGPLMLCSGHDIEATADTDPGVVCLPPCARCAWMAGVSRG